MRRLVKKVISKIVDAAAAAAGFSFPAKFNWRWKWEMLSGSYEKGTTRLLKKIVRPGMTVVDAGAHIGYFTRLFSHRVGKGGRVFAFEPDAENLIYLRQNTAGVANVDIVTEALSSKDGFIPFFHVAGSTGCHTTVAELSREVEETTVHATTLDAFRQSSRTGRIDLIKMDIEGGEWDAIAGMQNTLRTDSPAIVCEYNPAALSHSGKDPEKFFDILAEHSYTINAITERGIDKLSAPYGEAIKQFLGKEPSVNIYCTHE